MSAGGAGRAEPSQGAAHEARHHAESFGLDAARYDRARPQYPNALIRHIRHEAPGPRVLAVGTGTGIEARQLQAAGMRVLGVEPDARMAAFARRHGVQVEAGRFEEWRPHGRTFDAVVSGTAWHWVDPVEGARRAAAVLAEEGVFCAFWNVADVPHDVRDAFFALYSRIAPGTRAAGAYRPGPPLSALYDAIVDRAADGLERSASFGAPARSRWDRSLRYSSDQWLELVSTQGTAVDLDAPQQEALLAGMREEIDRRGGTLVVRYATLALTARRSV